MWEGKVSIESERLMSIAFKLLRAGIEGGSEGGQANANLGLPNGQKSGYGYPGIPLLSESRACRSPDLNRIGFFHPPPHKGNAAFLTLLHLSVGNFLPSAPY